MNSRAPIPRAIYNNINRLELDLAEAADDDSRERIRAELAEAMREASQSYDIE